MDEREWMQWAVREAQQGIAAGQTPFGAVIVRAGAVVAAAHNSVWRDGDPTAHAEVNCIRRAAATLETIDLNGGTMYSTCEPCPMCLAAIHWSKLERVVFGAAIADAASAGFAELRVDARVLAELGRSPLRVEGGLLREECVALFAQWRSAGLSRAY